MESNNKSVFYWSISYLCSHEWRFMFYCKNMLRKRGSWCPVIYRDTSILYLAMLSLVTLFYWLPLFCNAAFFGLWLFSLKFLISCDDSEFFGTLYIYMAWISHGNFHPLESLKWIRCLTYFSLCMISQILTETLYEAFEVYLIEKFLHTHELWPCSIGLTTRSFDIAKWLMTIWNCSL
jgi:hypothetical protein